MYNLILAPFKKHQPISYLRYINKKFMITKPFLFGSFFGRYDNLFEYVLCKFSR